MNMLVSTVHDHERMSTQDLLLSLGGGGGAGARLIFIFRPRASTTSARPAWNREGRKLRFTVSNPGQRVAWRLLDTEILVGAAGPGRRGLPNAGGGCGARRRRRHGWALRRGRAHLRSGAGRHALRPAQGEARSALRAAGTLGAQERGQLFL